MALGLPLDCVYELFWSRVPYMSFGAARYLTSRHPRSELQLVWRRAGGSELRY